MTPDELVKHHPRLFHMAEGGAWASIKRIGLRTTAQLVDECETEPAIRALLLESRRAESTELTHPVVGAITIRDQKPLALHNLRLTDVDLPGFLNLLNTRVFLWTSERRLQGLLGAKAYRDREHDILVLDTASIVADYEDQIRLTTMNTGASIFPNAPKRGTDSFYTIDEFPFDERRKSRRAADAVVEVCVIDGIHDVAKHVTSVERRRGPKLAGVVFER